MVTIKQCPGDSKYDYSKLRMLIFCSILIALVRHLAGLTCVEGQSNYFRFLAKNGEATVVNDSSVGFYWAARGSVKRHTSCLTLKYLDRGVVKPKCRVIIYLKYKHIW